MKYRKYLVLIAFLLIISIPGVLSLINIFTGVKIDTELDGFNDRVDKPELIVNNVWSGDFQSQYSEWLDQNITSHAFMTKTYNSIRLKLFDVSTKPIGKDGFIYDPAYIEAELALGDEYDFSIEANQIRMKEFVDSLISVNNKLESKGKHLYVYIAPSKADCLSDKIPQDYQDVASGDSINAADYFVSLIDKTDIKYLLCSDLVKNLEYPDFYTTGIHWSRTYEQYASNEIIMDLQELTGKSYRHFEFDGVTESTTPFLRDTDIYELLNIWGNPTGTYYQYNCKPIYPENYEKLRVFLYGDSFAQGLRSDVFDMFPNESIYYVNYDNYILDYSNFVEIHHDYSNIDWQTCLDRSDVVVIEMNEALVKDFSTGFVQYLDTYLDTYVPMEVDHHYMDNFDATKEIDYSEIVGVYPSDGAQSWTSRAFAMELENPEITSNGLEIQFAVPDMLLSAVDSDTVIFDVNGICKRVNTYTSSDIQTIYFEPDEIISDDGKYSVSCYCSDSFNPTDFGWEDDRDLGLVLMYIGARR